MPRGLVVTTLVASLLLLLGACNTAQEQEPAASRPAPAIAAQVSTPTEPPDAATAQQAQDDQRPFQAATTTVIKGVFLSPGVIVRGGDLTLEVELREDSPELSALRYDWFVNDELYGFSRGEVLPGDAFVRGDKIYVEVTPEIDNQDARVFRSDVFEVPNAPPIVTSSPTAATFAEGVYRYKVTASDADEDDLEFFIEEAPEAMEINRETGLIVCPIPEDASGTVTYVVGVRDNYEGESRQRVEFRLVSGNGEGT